MPRVAALADSSVDGSRHPPVATVVGRRRGGDQRAPAVSRVALADGETKLREPVDEQAGGRLAEAQTAAELPDRLWAVHRDHRHGFELPHGEVERQQFRAGAAIQGGEHLVGRLPARGDAARMIRGHGRS
jgi:hypothetical protein